MRKAKYNKYNKYPKGAIAKIVQHTGLSRSFIYEYFNGRKDTKINRDKIQKALDELKINI